MTPQHEITLSYPSKARDGTVFKWNLVYCKGQQYFTNRNWPNFVQNIINGQLIESGATPVKRIEAEKMR